MEELVVLGLLQILLVQLFITLGEVLVLDMKVLEVVKMEEVMGLQLTTGLDQQEELQIREEVLEVMAHILE
jgi:hypothetical protein